jgi:hypothetical protein
MTAPKRRRQRLDLFDPVRNRPLLAYVTFMGFLFFWFVISLVVVGAREEGVSVFRGLFLTPANKGANIGLCLFLLAVGVNVVIISKWFRR